MAADELAGPDPDATYPYVVTAAGFDGMEVMFNVGRGVQTLVADEEGRIVAAVVPVGVWYPGARVPAGVPVLRPGQWLDDATDARVRRRAGPDEAPGAEAL